jgi:hypothetical protein
MDYSKLSDDHLDTSIRGRMMYENDGGKIMPMLEVEQLFEHKYDLEIQDTFEVTQFIEETRAEFAFDAAVVDDPDAVLDDIHKIVENFNEPPDDLPPEGKENWRSKTVVISDVQREDE